MATLFSDDFNRANSASLGANWTEPNGNTDIASNMARVVTGAAAGSINARTTTTAHAAVADQKVSITVKTAACDGGPVARSTATNTGYFLEAYSSAIDLYRTVAGSFTLIGSRATSVAVNDVLRLEAQGSTLRIFRNGTQLGANFTDTNITAAGQAGFLDFGTNCDYDDFLVEDFAAGGADDFPAGRVPAFRHVIRRGA